MIYSVAVVQWWDGDDIAEVIHRGLTSLGLAPVLISQNDVIPDSVDLVLTFAPYGRLLPIAQQFERFRSGPRPVYIHWNTENPPDPRIPWVIQKPISTFRSRVDSIYDSDRLLKHSVEPQLLHRLQSRFLRFRYQGDYHFAYRQGWLDLLAEYSRVYAHYHAKHGIRTSFVPWGTAPEWYADLHLERDIDVLWFGKRRTNRRSKLLDTIREQLGRHGVNMYIADGVEHAFFYGQERIKMINRSKFTLSLLTKPYESVFAHRFHVAAGNRCLVISEPEWDHHPQCVAGQHYVESNADEIVEKVLYYLQHEAERRQIIENAYQLVTQELTFENSLRKIVQLAEELSENSKTQQSCAHEFMADM